MTNSVNIVIRDLSTGAGRNSLTVWLRHATDNYATNQIQAVAVTGKQGVYEAQDVPYNKYKLWVNGTEDETFGGTNGRWLPEGESVIRLSSGHWNAGFKKLQNVADPAADTDALNRQTGDDRYVMGNGSNDPGLWYAIGTYPLDLTTREVSVAAATDDAHPVQKVQLDDAVADLETEIAGIVVTPYQEDTNQIRLIPGGSTKTGQVYTTWNAAFGYLKSLTPSSTKRFVVEIGGVGISGATTITVTENDGGSPPTNYFNDYCSVFIKNRFIKLQIPDDTMGAGAIGRTSIEGGTFFIDDTGANPVIQNLYFVNVYIDFRCESATFVNCVFENCFIKINENADATATFTTCKGSGNTSNQTLPASVTGWGEISRDDF